MKLPANGILTSLCGAYNALRASSDLTICVVAWLAAGSLVIGAESPDTVVLRFDLELRPTVAIVRQSAVRLSPGEVGLVVWSEGGRERWQIFRGAWSKTESAARLQPDWLVTDSGSSRGGATHSPAGTVQLTTLLDPLLSPSVIKALGAPRETGFLTPPDGGVVLGPGLTIRRSATEGQPLPAATAVLSGGGATARIAFSENQRAVALREIGDLPETWRAALPAGAYKLQWEADPRPAVTFTVETPDRRQQVMKWLHQWTRSTQGRSKALDALIAVEYLASAQPQPYLADALDAIDGLPPDAASHYLQHRPRAIVSLLQTGQEPAVRDQASDATGIPEIDQARQLIARGRWAEATNRLQAAADSPDLRARALADLYRGVVNAEAGLGQEQAADFYFRRALAGMVRASASDQFRANNDIANFLLNRAQDRLYSHAFQMAAGAGRLFLTALASWEEARSHYESAHELAKALGPAQQAAALVNLARLDATLADLIATLDTPGPGGRQLQAAEEAINRTADALARQAAVHAANVDPFVSAVAETIQAQLAFRAHDAAGCREHAQQALATYIDCGSLAGIESVERLLGLVELRASEFAGEHQADAAAREAALAHFQTSQLLAELLRAQVPPDRVGLTRAGFFARRVYVTERIVELLIDKGEYQEALRYVELGKARALQDLMTTADSSGPAGAEQTAELDEILARWPRDVLAIEYFLTSERAWVFAIAGGKVRAYPIVREDGRPLPARELVSQVHAVLRGELDHYAPKMQKRLLDGSGFDHAWQDKFHELERRLLPAEVLAQLSHAPALLIVPHHILHYFPFAALVTQPDAAHRSPLEMVQPRMLIDEPCDICYAPSLAVWHSLRQRPDREMTEAAAVGIAKLPGAEPLPGVQMELQSLRAALGQRLRIAVTDEDAHKANALGLLRQPGLLLVGTHGQNWPDQPLASELFLYPQDTDNGRLTAAELYGSTVGRDLTVLSACYTALADKSPLPGDDLFGLQRALLQAGGRTVVAGQWDIYDRCGPELMQNFFAHLAKGEAAPRALAEAQRQFLRRLRSSSEPEPWLHPYFWAVFTVCGDDRARFQVVK